MKPHFSTHTPATVPITVLSSNTVRQASTDVPYHPAYNGTVFFRNTFDGQLPASDYPKVNVCAFTLQIQCPPADNLL